MQRASVSDVFKNTIVYERDHLQALLDKTNLSLIEEIVNQLALVEGKIIISGIGKSGMIGKKISATFTSTGTKAVFMHATEALHGDLGIIDQGKDYVILISNSGETEEVIGVLNYCRLNKVKTLGISSNSKSTLAQYSNLHIDIKVEKESCINGLAPTTSTTTTLVVGDAIANSLAFKKNFSREDFFKFHPGGSLGKKSISKVKNYLITTDLPLIHYKERSFDNIIRVIAKTNHGVGLFIDDHNRLVGIITDGDIKRIIDTGLYKDDTSVFYNERFIYFHPEETIKAAEKVFKENKIQIAPVLNENKELIGIFKTTCYESQ